MAIFFISAKAIDEFFKNLDICVRFGLKVRNQRSNVLKTTFENFFSPGSLCGCVILQAFTSDSTRFSKWPKKDFFILNLAK